MTHDLLEPNPANTPDFIMMTVRVYSTKNTWYIEYEVIGTNVLDLINHMCPKTTTLADIDITKTREARILQAIAESYSVPQSNPENEAKHKRFEVFVHETKTSEVVD